MFSSQPFDMDAYEKRSKGPCFLCEMLAGHPDYQHHLIYEGHAAVAFLNKYPTVYGYALVAPREHREQATGVGCQRYASTLLCIEVRHPSHLTPREP